MKGWALTFLKIEEKNILALNGHHAVIATGGSVVYSKQGMEHLKTHGTIIYLKISFEKMLKRLKNIKTRGIVLIPGQSLLDMYDQRIPLYEKYADMSIDCSDDDFEKVVDIVVAAIKKCNYPDLKADQTILVEKA